MYEVYVVVFRSWSCRHFNCCHFRAELPLSSRRGLGATTPLCFTMCIICLTLSTMLAKRIGSICPRTILASALVALVIAIPKVVKTRIGRLQKSNSKLNQLSKAVRAAADNVMPTCLGLAEVENDMVVKKLASKLNYATVIVSRSKDARGIDVALLCNAHPLLATRTPVVTEHEIRSRALSKPTRPVLEVELFLKSQQSLHILVNHWPSQGAPTATRRAAADVVASLAQAAASQPGHYVLAMGDFNTVDRDTPSPFTALTDANLVDAHVEFMADDSVSADIKQSLPPGDFFLPA